MKIRDVSAHTSRRDTEPVCRCQKSRKAHQTAKWVTKLSFDSQTSVASCIDFCQPNICISFEDLNLKLFWRLASVTELCTDRRSVLLCPSAGSYQCGTWQQGPEVPWAMSYASSPSFQDWQTTLGSGEILLLKELWTTGESQLLLSSTTTAEAHHIVK